MLNIIKLKKQIQLQIDLEEAEEAKARATLTLEDSGGDPASEQVLGDDGQAEPT